MAGLRRRIPEVAGISEIFSVLGDETRCRVAYLLSLEELCTCELSEILGISMPAVSHHLRLLKALRLVKARPMGKHVFYSLADDHVMSLIRVAQEHYEEEGQLCGEAGQADTSDAKETERGAGQGEGDDTRA
jgi:ArsR family transcriptional regulator